LPNPSALQLPRRQLLTRALLAPLWPGLAWLQVSRAAAATLVKRELVFARDLGSHPDTAIEWWYVTGELQAKQQQYGFQLTFFRSRVPATQHMTSAFAARQLIFAHAAVTDLSGQRLLHDQRIARSSGTASVDLAEASEADTHIRLRDWSLQRREDGRYLARVTAQDFAFALDLTPTQPLLLQGEQGWSRKGPQATQASFYYSLPQLKLAGDLTLAGSTRRVSGRAWLDHEWSDALLHPEAVGWDWIGMNLFDGAALTAFRLRNKAGATLWAGGSWRGGGAAKPVVFAAQDVRFKAGRIWKSPASGASYPVQWTIDLPAAAIDAGLPARTSFTVRALLDAQELDSRSSTGAIYWEGLSELSNQSGQPIGRGYLEMTGYASPLKLS